MSRLKKYEQALQNLTEHSQLDEDYEHEYFSCIFDPCITIKPFIGKKCPVKTKANEVNFIWCHCCTACAPQKYINMFGELRSLS